MEVRPAHSIRLDSAPLLLNTGPRVACCRRSALPHPHAHQLGTISARGISLRADLDGHRRTLAPSTDPHRDVVSHLTARGQRLVAFFPASMPFWSLASWLVL
jgi:hypothetical protein